VTSSSLVLALVSIFLRYMWRLLSVLVTVFRDGEVTSSSLVLALVSVPHTHVKIAFCTS
jgi:hypothetical protein